MRRREFIVFLGSAATAWPIVGQAQQAADRVRVVGILQWLTASDPEWRRRFDAFKQSLRQLGWSEGQNIVFESRFADAKPERLAALAAELVQANVDVIVTSAAQPIEAARSATNTIPIVMASVGDAPGGGYVANLARPGGNITGFNTCRDRSGRQAVTIDQGNFSEPNSRCSVLECRRIGTSAGNPGDGTRCHNIGDHAAIFAEQDHRRYRDEFAVGN
jgi:hypothetical protein